MSDAQTQAEALWNQAAKFHDEGKWTQAVDAYSQFLNAAPNFVPAYVQRGLVLVEMGNPAEASYDFERALQLDPNYGLAHYGRGWIKHLRGDYRGELQDARRGLELDSSNAGMYYRRMGAAHLGLEQYDDAISNCNRAIFLNSNQDRGTIFNRGLCYVHLHKYELALADFERCLILDPDWSWALVERGRVHLELGNFDQAIADCNAAIGYQRDYVQAYIVRGTAYNKKGDSTKAWENYESAMFRLATSQVRKFVTHVRRRIFRKQR